LIAWLRRQHTSKWQEESMALADWGNQVLELLKKGLGERPLIFITHSMGIGIYTSPTAPSPKGEQIEGFRRG